MKSYQWCAPRCAPRRAPNGGLGAHLGAWLGAHLGARLQIIKKNARKTSKNGPGGTEMQRFLRKTNDSADIIKQNARNTSKSCAAEADMQRFLLENQQFYEGGNPGRAESIETVASPERVLMSTFQ